ncbi:MAG: carboxymuconolactone decarboxylase family protein [Alphaproteobacteria bacterium]|nr:carboxymuconolactone decarboxylase family protein [Alphaproteobacteria bacterium]
MIDTIKNALPDYAKDLKLNLSSVLAAGALTPAQSWGTALASALAAGEPRTIAAVAAEAATHVGPEVRNAARIAAALMAMNNVYYRFTHLVAAKDYAEMRAGLRMNAMMNPGVPAADFELMSLAVSAINGCGMCMDSHEKTVRKHGVTPEQVQAAVKIAAVIHAVSRTLAAEASLAEPLAAAA